MDNLLCFICSERFSNDVADFNLKQIYLQTVGYQFPCDRGVCYICSHKFIKFDTFRRYCIKNHSESVQSGNNLQEVDIKGLKQPFHYTKRVLVDMLLCLCVDCINTEEEKRNLYEEYACLQSLQCDIENNLPDLYKHDKCNTSPVSDDYNVRSIEIDKELTHIYENDLDNETSKVKSEIITDDDSNVTSNKQENDVKISDNESNGDSENDVIINNDDSFSASENESEMNTKQSNSDNENDLKVVNTEVHFTKILLSVEEQKAELELTRKSKKFIEAQFKCYNCALYFPFKDSYKSHMVRHEESNGEHSCEICGLRFASRNTRRMHWAMHAERHRCGRCGERVKRAGRRQHAGRCGGAEPATCHRCAKTFPNTISLQQHVRRVHSKKSKTKVYRCNICSQVYENSSSLRRHTITHGNTSYRCEACPAHFSDPYALRKHAANHATTPQHYCQPCDKWFKYRKTYVAHLNNTAAHTTHSYECAVCARVCPTRRQLEQHAQTHRAARHACAACGRRYHTPVALRRHARRHLRDSETPTVVCHLCGKVFKGSPHKLKRHLQNACKANLAPE